MKVILNAHGCTAMDADQELSHLQAKWHGKSIEIGPPEPAEQLESACREHGGYFFEILEPELLADIHESGGAPRPYICEHEIVGN